MRRLQKVTSGLKQVLLMKISAPIIVTVKEGNKYHARRMIRKGTENKTEQGTVPFCKLKTVCAVSFLFQKGILKTEKKHGLQG